MENEIIENETEDREIHTNTQGMILFFTGIFAGLFMSWVIYIGNLSDKPINPVQNPDCIFTMDKTLTVDRFYDLLERAKKEGCVNIIQLDATPIPQSIEDKEYWKREAERQRKQAETDLENQKKWDEEKREWERFCGQNNIERDTKEVCNGWACALVFEWQCKDASKIPPKNLEL